MAGGSKGLAVAVAAENAVGGLDGAALPGRVGIAEEGLGRQRRGQVSMRSELGAGVERDGFPRFRRQGSENRLQRLSGLDWRFGLQGGGKGKAGLPLAQCEEVAALGAEPHEVALPMPKFPMPEFLAVLNRLGTRVDGSPPRDRLSRRRLKSRRPRVALALGRKR